VESLCRWGLQKEYSGTARARGRVVLPRAAHAGSDTAIAADGGCERDFRWTTVIRPDRLGEARCMRVAERPWTAVPSSQL